MRTKHAPVSGSRARRPGYPDTESRHRHAFSLVEALVAIGILTFGLLPIVSMYQSTTKKGGMSEYHIFFQSRAVRVVEFYSSYNVAFFISQILQAGQNQKVELPIQGKIVDPALPAEYAAKLKGGRLEEHCTIQFEEGAQLDLVRLSVTIRWQFPLDNNVHSYTLTRLFGRPDITLADNDVVFPLDTPTHP